MRVLALIAFLLLTASAEAAGRYDAEEAARFGEIDDPARLDARLSEVVE